MIYFSRNIIFSCIMEDKERVQEDLFYSNNLLFQHNRKLFNTQVRSGTWKDVIYKILKDKAEVKTAFEAQIRKLKTGLHHGDVYTLVVVTLDPRL